MNESLTSWSTVNSRIIANLALRALIILPASRRGRSMSARRMLWLLLCAVFFFCAASSNQYSTEECSDIDNLQPIHQKTRGTTDLVSNSRQIRLLQTIAHGEFVGSSGYESNQDGRTYTAPQNYSGLGLRELSESNQERYTAILETRERVRSIVEESLGIGKLYIDYTTLSQKTIGGAHKAHADNCIHFFDTETHQAECDPGRVHPYPNRVAGSILYLNDHESGNFSGGEFYFADRANGEVSQKIPLQVGRLIYFTAGVESLHGALPVAQSTEDSTPEPRRLALAMWFVKDSQLEEYVPPFGSKIEMQSSSAAKPRAVNDPNDPTAPKHLFDIPMPKSVEGREMLQSLGAHLLSKSAGSWQIQSYNSDTLHVVFKDHTAMFSIEVGMALSEESVHSDTCIVFERHTDGKRPASLLYMLQESVILHIVLDELSSILLDKENAYFTDAFEKARITLPAKRA